jgi:hypothetical protein
MASAEDELREALLGSEPEETRESRQGRLVEPDAGGAPDLEKDVVAEEVDDGEENLSAEEAAVHIVDEAP